MDDPMSQLWPEPGERLFELNPDEFDGIACVNFSADEWEGYAEGYHRAGRYLADRVCQTGRDQDFLVYPIIFCYRHALEVRLKQLLIAASEVVEAGKLLVDTHDLPRLWSLVRPLLESVWPQDGENGPHIVAAGEQLAELGAMDHRSDAFRYPVTTPNKEGRRLPSISPQVTRLDLRTFADRADKLLNMFDGLHCGLLAKLDEREPLLIEYEAFRAEVEAEWRAIGEE